jgi:UDP-2-acetamido-3-amino-2,3-dideoxy-glucuronate N-acetyltransferase
MKILQIGLGRWGKNHLKALTKLCSELYVVDVDPEQLKICDELAIPADHRSTDYRDFLDRVDGVDIVTPADNHLAITRDCFSKQKDVFVEKPIAFTSGEAKEMIALAEGKGLILQVGDIYRYNPAVSKIKSLTGEGRLGKIQYAYGHFMGFKRPRMDVGVTQTDAIHYFDLFNYLFGELPHAVRAVVRHYLNLALDDTSISVLEYGGKLAFVEAGYMPPETRRDISIIGDRGSLYCNFQKNTLSFFENRHEKQGDRWVAIEGKPQDVPLEGGEPLKLELVQFLNSIKTRSRPIADGQAGLEALRVVEACYESSRQGKLVEIDWNKG